MLMRLGLVAALVLGTVAPAVAVPAKIIILRHGEKQDAFALCSVGVQRSLALSTQYLGKGAKDSLFASGETPAAFLVITLHTLELASPAAQTWNAPLVDYSAVPIKDNPLGDSEIVLNTRTQQAAADVLTNPLYKGKTVVLVREHKHIANKKLEKAYPNEKVTLRQLLGLDKISGDPVPDKWEGDNYDYFWIVTYGNAGSAVPTAFTTQKQHFDKPYDGVPHNDWGKPATLPKDCKS